MNRTQVLQFSDNIAKGKTLMQKKNFQKPGNESSLHSWEETILISSQNTKFADIVHWKEILMDSWRTLTSWLDRQSNDNWNLMLISTKKCTQRDLIRASTHKINRQHWRTLGHLCTSPSTPEGGSMVR